MSHACGCVQTVASSRCVDIPSVATICSRRAQWASCASPGGCFGLDQPHAVGPDVATAALLFAAGLDHDGGGAIAMLDSIGQILPWAARTFGDRTAVVCDGRTFTFRELNKLAAHLAGRLLGLGLQPGDRVSLYGENRWEWIVSYHAIARLGLWCLRVDCLGRSRPTDPAEKAVSAARDHPVR